MALAMRGTVQVQSHVLRVAQFNQVKLTEGIRVEVCINPDSAGMVMFNAPIAIVNSIEFEVNKKGRLQVKVDREVAPEGTKMPTVKVYTRSLTQVENTGDSTLTVSGLWKYRDTAKLRVSGNGKIVAYDIEADKVEAQIITGGGKILIGGKCTSASLTNLGVGEIQADKLHATDVSAKVVGTGTIGCWVDGGKLKVIGAGGGNLYYKGSPGDFDVQKIGTLKVQPM